MHVDVAAVDTALAVDIGGAGGGSLAQHDVDEHVQVVALNDVVWWGADDDLAY